MLPVCLVSLPGYSLVAGSGTWISAYLLSSPSGISLSFCIDDPHSESLHPFVQPAGGTLYTQLQRRHYWALFSTHSLPLCFILPFQIQGAERGGAQEAGVLGSWLKTGSCRQSAALGNSLSWLHGQGRPELDSSIPGKLHLP